MRAAAFILALLLAWCGAVLSSRVDGSASTREAKAASQVRRAQQTVKPHQRLARAHRTAADGGRRRPRGRRRAVAAVPCPDNLRSLGAAMRLYLQDWGERLPPSERWVDALKPYVKRRSVWHCPRDLSGRQVSYAMNRRLGGCSIGNERWWNRVLLFESKIGRPNVADDGRSLPSPGRHRGGNYYLFGDGRIEWHKERPPF